MRCYEPYLPHVSQGVDTNDPTFIAVELDKLDGGVAVVDRPKGKQHKLFGQCMALTCEHQLIATYLVPMSQTHVPVFSRPPLPQDY
jgi:hypothetical protein